MSKGSGAEPVGGNEEAMDVSSAEDDRGERIASAESADADWRVEFVPPDTTVRFDGWAGCGVNVLLKRDGNVGEFVELAFVTGRRSVESHYLRLAQIEQLRAAIDAVTRKDGPAQPYDYLPGEPLYVITPDGPAGPGELRYRRSVDGEQVPYLFYPAPKGGQPADVDQSDASGEVAA